MDVGRTGGQVTLKDPKGHSAAGNPSRQAPKHPFQPQACQLCDRVTLLVPVLAE